MAQARRSRIKPMGDTTPKHRPSLPNLCGTLLESTAGLQGTVRVGVVTYRVFVTSDGVHRGDRSRRRYRMQLVALPPDRS